MTAGEEPIRGGFDLTFGLAELVALVRELTPEVTVAVYDHQLRYLHADGPGLAAPGLETGGIVGRTFPEIVAASVAELLQPYYERALAGESGRFEFVSPETGLTYVQRFAPIRNASGDVICAMATWQEVTEAKHHERELAASEARFRLLAERSGDAIVVLGLDGAYEYVSPALEAMTGWSADELIGRRTDEFIHPDDLGGVAERRTQLSGGVEVAIGEVRFRRRAGGYTWLETVSTPIVDEATGAVRGVQASGRDISARKNAEEIFRALSTLAPVGIFMTDAGGGCAYVNARWEEIAGLTGAEAAGTGWIAALHPDDRERVLGDWGEATRAGGEPVLDCRFQHADGTVRHVVAAGVPLRDAEGGTVGYIGSLTDVTDLKEAQDERLRLEAGLEQARKLESLGVLAGGIAHDFNNLLVGVLGNAALALAELPPGTAARTSVEQVEIAARRAAELTRQMLAYSGSGQLLVGRVDLAELISELVHVLEAAIGDNVVLRLDLPAGLPQVEGDVTQLRQVVMNLIVNAGEAIGSRPGVVEVELALVEVDRAALARLEVGAEIAPGPYLALRVADTGSGMDATTRARIFDPFFTTKFTGRGLGLAATLGIVRGHRGGLEVVTREGHGTTFTVYLPPVAAGQATAALPPESRAGQLSGTVLLIEDDATVREVSQRMLEYEGLEVVSVADGLAAFEAVAAEPGRFVAVVLDITMPGLAGEALLVELRARGLVAPVVLMSGHLAEDVAVAVTWPGVKAFLQKPFGAEELARSLHEALDAAARERG